MADSSPTFTAPQSPVGYDVTRLPFSCLATLTHSLTIGCRYYNIIPLPISIGRNYHSSTHKFIIYQKGDGIHRLTDWRS